MAFNQGNTVTIKTSGNSELTNQNILQKILLATCSLNVIVTDETRKIKGGNFEKKVP